MLTAGRLLKLPLKVDHQGMNSSAEEHNRPGPASSSAAAGEPDPDGGVAQGPDEHAASNGRPGTASSRRAVFARDATARASAAVPEQRRPEQRPGEQRDSSTQPRTPDAAQGDGARQDEDDGSGIDGSGIEFSIEAIEPAEEEIAGPNWLADRFTVIGRAARRRLARFGVALLVIASRDWLEAIAVLVQGVGGAIFPPIWFIGALIIAVSKKLDLRDKWLGLALPVLAVMFGATMTIVLGGQHSSLGAYAFEGWLAAGRLSRIAAVLGAAYLLWRLHRGLRGPRRPPWSPRKQG
jgi:hypothetical protein